jgi:gas vesicle protein
LGQHWKWRFIEEKTNARGNFFDEQQKRKRKDLTMCGTKIGVFDTIRIKAIFIGELVGAVTGFLSTPQHSGDARQQIREFYHEGVRRGDEFAKKAQERIPEFISGAKRVQGQIGEIIRGTAEDIKALFRILWPSGKTGCT